MSGRKSVAAPSVAERGPVTLWTSPAGLVSATREDLPDGRCRFAVEFLELRGDLRHGCGETVAGIAASLWARVTRYDDERKPAA